MFTQGHFNQIHEGVVGHHNDYYDCLPIVTSGIYGVPYGEVGQRTESASPFVNVEARDFRLVAGSNAIGNGANLSLIFTTDIVGNVRTTWDIGAYSYRSSTQPITPAAPSRLRVENP